jgi:predicted Zn finger-like uncharacterized protein
VKLSCPSCAAKYSIADEKVQDRLAKIRCRKCSATIIVDGKVNPPSVYTSDGAPPAAEFGDAGGAPAGGGGGGGGEYSVDFGDNDQRTMTVLAIVQAYRRGELTADTYVWAEGFGDWQAIAEVPELAEALGGGDTGAAPPRAAARTGAGRGSATDLFGGIATAGSEEDVMTSAPQGAAPAGVATGARNESSVLFSLSALTASAPAGPSLTTKSSPSPSAASNGKDDDSGLIDLKALTSAVGNQGPINPLMLGTAPLGMAAPLGGMTAPVAAFDGPYQRPASSKTGIYIAAAMILVGALIAGAIVMTGNKEAPAAASPAVAPAPVAAATAEPKKEEPTAAPPATGTAEVAKDTAPKPASAPKVAHYTSKKSSSSGSSGASEKAAEKAPEKSSSSSSDTESSGSSDAPKKKKEPKKEKTCNCGPGDLMCAMKCAAS